MHSSSQHGFAQAQPPKPSVSLLRDGMTGFQLLTYLNEADALDMLNALRLIPEPRPPIVETVGTLLRDRLQAIKDLRGRERAGK